MLGENPRGFERHRLEVEVDEGIVVEPCAAPEGDVVDAGGLEIGEPRVERGRLADDHGVGDPPLHDALQVLQGVLVGAAEEDDEVERLATQGAPDTLEDREEPGVGVGGERAGRDHGRDDAGAAAAQAAAGLVRDVAGARSGFLDPGAGLRVDVRPIVQRSADRADRQLQLVGELADSHAFLRRPRSSICGGMPRGPGKGNAVALGYALATPASERSHARVTGGGVT